MRTTTRVYKIDANGRRLGRLASEIANVLNGKDSADYKPNQVPDVFVEINNVSSLQIDSKKIKQKEYDTYSGYPGGRKVFNMERLIDKKGYSEVLRKAIFGMLPSNKLRAIKMRRVKMKE